MSIKAIETRYAGCHFRSRLEARWAVFFDDLGIAWEYEPQGFEFSDGTKYLPDFLLTECSTWVEVRGSNDRVDLDRLEFFASELPEMERTIHEYEVNGTEYQRKSESGPRLMLLGPIPRPDNYLLSGGLGDLTWLGTHGDGYGWGRYGFGMFHKNRRPWWGDYNCAASPLHPGFDPYETGCRDAYNAARSARFEHGQSGAT